MESEKVKDIKKGLECLSGHRPCDLCFYHEIAEQQETCCINVVAEEVIDYINELESENKELNNELKRYKMDWLNSEKMHLQADMEDTEFELFCANKSLEEVRAENRQLKDENERLKKEIKAIHFTYETYNEKYIGQLKDLKKENQQLKDRIALLEKQNETLRNAKVVYETVDYYAEDLKKAEMRIKELEKENKENNSYAKGYADGIKNTYEVVIPDKLKQFAERLKEKTHIKKRADEGWIVSYVEICNDIDETLKEFIKGEQQ